MPDGQSSEAHRVSYELQPEVSAVLIQARSTVGPIELATTSISGRVEASLRAGKLDLGDPPTATLELPVDSLRSGNALYDSEIHRRLDAPRYSRISAELFAARLTSGDTLAMSGRVTIHGETREMHGSAQLLEIDETTFVGVGEQSIDIRDFSISLPSALMLRIYPDVIVRFRLQGTRPTT